MESAILGAIGGAGAVLLLVALVALVRRRSRSRADLEAMLAAAQRESDDLRARLEALDPAHGAVTGPAHAEIAEFVITDAGMAPRDADFDGAEPLAVPDRLVLSATLGEPLVKVAAFSHGIRRALSAESRNRIWFEMRREVRAARKRRRRQVREYLRETRAEERAKVRLGGVADPIGEGLG